MFNSNGRMEKNKKSDDLTNLMGEKKRKNKQTFLTCKIENENKEKYVFQINAKHITQKKPRKEKPLHEHGSFDLSSFSLSIQNRIQLNTTTDMR